MKTMIKLKPLIITLVFLTIAISSITTVGNSNMTQIYGVFDYTLSEQPCLMCNNTSWWVAYDQLGNKYHGICSTCKYEEFY